MWEKTSHSRSSFRSQRSIEPPGNPFAALLRELLQKYNKTIYQLSADTGIDGAYLWRIVRGERVEISREVVIKIALAFAMDKAQAEQFLEILNPLLDRASFKTVW